MPEFVEYRQHIRLNQNFLAKLVKFDFDSPIEGVTEDLSQTGTLIKTKHWNTYQLRDKLLITIFLPPTFSGQDLMIGLRGKAVVTRLDQAKDGIAVKFTEKLRQFERVEKTDM